MNQATILEKEQEIQNELAKAKQLLQQAKLQDSIDVTNQILDEQPQNAEALYLLAVAQRYLKNTADALKTLEKLISISPGYGRAYQEQGHNFKLSNQLSEALIAFEKAVKSNPALLVSWRELIQLYKLENNHQSLNTAEAEFKRLSKLPAELISVSSLIHEGKLYQAEQICRLFLKNQPHNVEAMRLLAVLGMKLYVYDDAEFLLESCVEFEPDNWVARHDYVNILYKRQKFEKALEQATILREAYPNNIVFDISYANQNVSLGKFETALEVYDSVIERQPKFETPHLMKGHALKTIGRLDEGIESYQSAYKVKPDFGDAYWSLANLKTYRFSDDEMKQMHEQVERVETSLIDRFHMCFALGKAYEDRKDFEQSFVFYERGNELKKTQLRYQSEVLDNAMQRQIETCDADYFKKTQGFGGEYRDPIFIVGLPRVGSTLLEQILASHSQVDGTMELPNIIALSHRLNGRRMIDDDAQYPKIMRELDNEQFKEFADQFIDDTRCHRAGAPYFIDKMPNNFMHIGLIKTMLPNAKIIDARRHPMACCFSGFKQLFADGQEFTYGQKEIATYYKGYVRLMEHWDEVLPDQVLRVHYEHVVADLDTQVHRILDFCGLSFEQSCIDFYKTERSVRTPSSEQVRQPIYKGGLEQWRNYEPYLEVLKTELEKEIADYPMPPA